MTGSQAPPAPPSGPLGRYHRALPRLAVLLRGAELPASPDRWQNVYDLLLALHAQGRLPQQAAGLEPLLAPLLCRSAREQQQFGELFGRWLADLEPDPSGTGRGAEGSPKAPEPEPPPGPRLSGWLLGLVLLLVALMVGAYWYHRSAQPAEERPTTTVGPVAPQLNKKDAVAPPEAMPELKLQPVPPRTPLETPTLDPEHRARLQTLGDLLLLLPGVFALAWLLVRWLTWRTVLARRQGDPDDPLTAIGLDARVDDLLDTPPLRDALKRLHTPVAAPTRRLDVPATVARTARHAGLFQPVRRDRRVVPELVVLVEQRHAGDQMAGLAGQLVDRLCAAGLTLTRYDYRDSPRQVIGTDGRWRPLAEVAARHEGVRLLLATVIAVAGAWVADRAWHHGGRDAARPHLLALQNTAHAAYRVTVWHREETAGLAQALVGTLADDGFTAAIAGETLEPLPADAEPPRVNRIQWGDAEDVPMATHIERRLAYLTWGHDPEVTNRLGALAAQAGLAQPPGARELRVLLLTPGGTGSAFSDPLAHALTAEQIAGLVAPARPLPGQPQAQPPAPEQSAEKAAQPSAESTEPQPPREVATDVALNVQELQARINDLEQRLAAVRREMELELTGADGRPAGKGPNYRRLAEQARTIEGRLGQARRELQTLQGGAARQPPRPTGTIEPGRIFRDDLEGGGVGPEMVMLPGGSFLMGSPQGEPERFNDEGPQHRVTVQPFALGRTEVRFADYDRFAEATGRKRPDDGGWGRGDRPVIHVSWNDARAYAEWLSGQTGQRYRLPTEAQWEYAARAGTDTPFWTGRCIHTDQANYNGNYDYNGCGAKTGVYRGQTVPSGSLPANPFGLHEVAGNVWEWVEDCWHDSYQGAPTDGSAWLETEGGDCARRVLRGGGWDSSPGDLRSASRLRIPADAAFDNVGLRLARTP